LTLGFDFKDYRGQSFATNLSYFTTVLTNNGVASTQNSTIALPSNTRVDVNYMPLSWNWSGERPDKQGTTSFSIEQDVFPSFLESKRASFQAAADSRSAGGDYTKVLAGVTREENLRPGWALLWRAAGQCASEALISNEEFPLGGTAGARGYQEGETYGDDGWRTTLELRAPAAGIGSFPVSGGKVPAFARTSVFMDYGEAYLVDRPDAPAVREWGTGVGFFVTAGEHFDARLSLACALLNTPLTPAGTLRAYFSIGFQF
jgi:hemolysin activation/secretion protein